MRITGIIWLAEVVAELRWKHRVEQENVRQIFCNSTKLRFVEKAHRRGENVYSAMAQTDAGRYLTVLFVHKTDSRALILSARDMTRAERKRYERK